MNHEPDKSKIASALRALEWRSTDPEEGRVRIWGDGQVLLIAVPVFRGPKLASGWMYEYHVVSIQISDSGLHMINSDGDRSCWNSPGDADFFVSIED